MILTDEEIPGEGILNGAESFRQVYGMGAKAQLKKMAENIDSAMNGTSYWGKNCRTNRKRNCKCCQECPILALLEEVK